MDVQRDYGDNLNWLVNGGLFDHVTSEQRPDGEEGARLVKIWGRGVGGSWGSPLDERRQSLGSDTPAGVEDREVGSARRGDEGPERPGGSKQKQAKERNRAGAGGLRCVQALEGRGRPIFPADFIVPGSVLERPPPPLPCRARGCGRAPTRPRGRSLRSARTAASPARSPRSRVRVPPDPLSEARQGFPASSATLYKHQETRSRPLKSQERLTTDFPRISASIGRCCPEAVPPDKHETVILESRLALTHRKGSSCLLRLPLRAQRSSPDPQIKLGSNFQDNCRQGPEEHRQPREAEVVRPLRTMGSADGVRALRGGPRCSK
ncbi:unnamed protein product [Rangifer tarandus platyrhynchus]|uniref:Uncharacterized protein n=1 Tax=Rangifer tarandus platyrhynchus TaxID=3082113 RepID=A0ABN8Y3P1_RANTA|nr:unnamed protein product [Rangifer tarandus platyrhynchus]